jgi:hypothetical protein
VGRGYFQGIVEVWFLICMVIGGQGCPYFGEIVLAERMGFVLRFGDICIGWEGWFFPQDF